MTENTNLCKIGLGSKAIAKESIRSSTTEYACGDKAYIGAGAYTVQPFDVMSRCRFSQLNKSHLQSEFHSHKQNSLRANHLSQTNEPESITDHLLTFFRFAVNWSAEPAKTTSKG